MTRLLYLIFPVITVITLVSCDRDPAPGDESQLYGMWVKGNNHGDTIIFLKTNGKNIMRSNQSFNPGLNANTDREYVYSQGKLSLKLGTEFFPVGSFKWKTIGKSFEVEGIQFYMFMSATNVFFTFNKVD